MGGYMNYMMGGSMMGGMCGADGMGLVGILFVVTLLLSAAALCKNLFFSKGK
jgi:hypothetical protein